MLKPNQPSNLTDNALSVCIMFMAAGNFVRETEQPAVFSYDSGFKEVIDFLNTPLSSNFSSIQRTSPLVVTPIDLKSEEAEFAGRKIFLFYIAMYENHFALNAITRIMAEADKRHPNFSYGYPHYARLLGSSGKFDLNQIAAIITDHAREIIGDAFNATCDDLPSPVLSPK